MGASAQGVKHPVKWPGKVEKKSATEYVLVFDAVIENEWHMYSQFTPDGGPLAMEVVFKNQSGNFSLIGKAKESKTRTAYNDVFEVNETFFEGKAHIEQEIKIINPNLKTVDVDFDFQVCKEVCINSSKKFSIAVPSTFKMEEVPVVKEKREYDKKEGKYTNNGYSRARWQMDAHGYTRSSGERLLDPNEIATLEPDQIFKLFKKHSLSEVWDFEQVVSIAENLEIQGRKCPRFRNFYFP